MLKKRIIPCFDIQAGRVVKGVNFCGLRDAGDPVELAEQYVRDGADELVFLDIAATLENRQTLVGLVEEVARSVTIPFTVGGGIRDLAGAELLLRAGADKISLNSAALNDPELIARIARAFGSQAVVVAIDARYENGNWFVYGSGGTRPTGVQLSEWVVHAASLGAGELLLTSMNGDGTKSGFALDALRETCAQVNIPVIASGGAGTMEHFREVFTETQASAALAASVFHFGEIAIPELKQYLRNAKIPIR